MPTLYVTEPGATVRLRGGALAVTPSTRSRMGQGAGSDLASGPREYEMHRLELVALVGHVQITADALRACLREGVTVAFFGKAGRFHGRLLPAAPRSADLRRLQYAEHSDADSRLDRACRVIAVKARNAAAVLRGIQSNESRNPALPEALARLKSLAPTPSNSGALDTLRGHEGNLARIYFRALATAFRGPIGLPGRRRRPPPDPANALLSFGYVLLGNLLAGRLEARGFDPALGFFHATRPGRPSLALDLLEEFRHPVVDRFVLRACNLRILRPEHFEADPERPGGIRLTRDGLKRFFYEWEKHLLQPLRETVVELVQSDGSHGQPVARASKIAVLPLLDRQIERLVADLRGGPAYRPFQYRA